MKQGLQQEFHEDGSLKSEYYCHAGEIHGSYIEWYPGGDGKIHFSSTYQNGERVNTLTEYYPSGNKKVEILQSEEINIYYDTLDPKTGKQPLKGTIIHRDGEEIDIEYTLNDNVYC